MAYVPLDIRTEYSFGDGASRIEVLIERARAWGLEAAGIADLNSTFGWVPFAVAARAAGIHPILGVTLQLDLEDDEWIEPAEIQLLARDRDGGRNLLQLVSRAHLENPDGRPRVHVQDLEGFATGVLALDGGQRGPLMHLLRAGRVEAAERLAARLRRCFGADGFYARLDRRQAGGGHALEAAHLHLARQLNIPIVAAPTVRGSDASEAEAAAFLRRMHGVTASDPAAGEPLLSEREMHRLYRDLPEAVSNTCVVAALCRGDLALDERRPLVLATQSGSAPEAELRDACERGARERYDVGSLLDLPAAVRDRLAHELAVIEARELASCFVIVRDVVRHAKEEGIFVGPGCGSAAGSLVCYLAGITGVDPLQHGLSFERFVGSAPSVPEFVLEVERGRAADLGAWFTRRVGAASVVGVADAQVLGHGQAMQALARLEGLDATAVEGDPTRALEAGIRPPQLLSLHERARALEGLATAPRHRRGSFLVTTGPATDSVALARVGDAIVAQIGLDSARALGFLHVEIVPSRDAGVLQECRRRLASRRAVKLPADPAADAITMRALSSGDAVTVPGFDSGAVLHLLEQLEPQDFEDLVAILALEHAARRNPAVVSQYTAAVAGYVPTDADADVAAILLETRGILLYPEQVTAIAMAVAEMSADEAEALRVALHHRNIGDLARGRARFVRGAVENHRAVAEAERIFGLLLRFDLHEFDKAHACGRVRLGLEAAMLRAHHPRSYAAALLQENAGRLRRQREILVDAVAHGVAREELDAMAGGTTGSVEPRRNRRATNQLEMFSDPVQPGSQLEDLVQHASLWSPKEARPSSLLPHLAAGAHVRLAGVVREASSTGRSLAVGQIVLEDPWGRFDVMVTPRTHLRGFERELHPGCVVTVHGRLDRKRGKGMVVANRIDVATIASAQRVLFVGDRRAADARDERTGAGSRRPNAERHPSRPDIRVPRAAGARRRARRADLNHADSPGFPLLGG